MNAGTNTGETKDMVTLVRVVNLFTGQDREHVPTISSFSYRHNHFLGDADVVTSARVRFVPADPIGVAKQVADRYQLRKNTQPVDLPSCGSVFMNPKLTENSKLVHAWQVIDHLGLRGFAIGGARFSEKHCNFIVNEGNAKASDVRALIDLAMTRAQNELGITLQPEVKMVTNHGEKSG
jgi:UDP-N-acetylmuramate dehydrogenase